MSRSALNKAFVEALDRDFAKHGKKTLEALRRDSPSRYLALAARLLPRAREEPPQSASAGLMEFLDAARTGKFKLPKPTYPNARQLTRDRLVGALMDQWHSSHAEAREMLHEQCPELAKALDALYAHGDTGKA